jgi:heme exporter protein B
LKKTERWEPAVWRDALLVAGKDLRIEMRSRVATNQVLPFAVLVLILFAFALGPGRTTLQAGSAGLFWLAVLLCTVLAVQRSFALESSEGVRDGMRASVLDPAGVFLGKAAAIAVQLMALQAVLIGGVVLLYGTRLSDLPMVLGACLLATIGLSSAGTIYGALSLGLKVRETLLPLLLLPIVAPVLLAGAKTWEAAIHGVAPEGMPWLRILGLFAVVYVVVGALVYGPLSDLG